MATLTAPLSTPGASSDPNPAFGGVWKCVDNAPNFGDFLKASGVPWLARKMLTSTKPTQTITVSPDGSIIDMEMSNGPKTVKMRCPVGVEAEFDTPGGKQKGTATWEDGNIVFVGSDKEGKAIRQVRVLEDGGAALRLFMESEGGGSTWRLFTRKEGK